MRRRQCEKIQQWLGWSVDDFMKIRLCKSPKFDGARGLSSKSLILAEIESTLYEYLIDHEQ